MWPEVACLLGVCPQLLRMLPVGQCLQAQRSGSIKLLICSHINSAAFACVPLPACLQLCVP